VAKSPAATILEQIMWVCGFIVLAVVVILVAHHLGREKQRDIDREEQYQKWLQEQRDKP
jgi:hypothetical protein